MGKRHSSKQSSFSAPSLEVGRILSRETVSHLTHSVPELAHHPAAPAVSQGSCHEIRRRRAPKESKEGISAMHVRKQMNFTASEIPSHQRLRRPQVSVLHPAAMSQRKLGRWLPPAVKDYERQPGSSLGSSRRSCRSTSSSTNSIAAIEETMRFILPPRSSASSGRVTLTMFQCILKNVLKRRQSVSLTDIALSRDAGCGTEGYGHYTHTMQKEA